MYYIVAKHYGNVITCDIHRKQCTKVMVYMTKRMNRRTHSHIHCHFQRYEVSTKCFYRTITSLLSQIHDYHDCSITIIRDTDQSWVIPVKCFAKQNNLITKMIILIFFCFRVILPQVKCIVTGHSSELEQHLLVLSQHTSLKVLPIWKWGSFFWPSSTAE